MLLRASLLSARCVRTKCLLNGSMTRAWFWHSATGAQSRQAMRRGLASSSSSAGTARLFDKVLVANRGEIACRVSRTLRRLGIRSVGVFSEADKFAQHVKMMDEAYHIGPAAAAESYLRGERILEVAKRSGAQAVHPGYGFLSENAKFAELCEAEGVTFIGPPPRAIRDMGSKSASKAIMSKAGVPITPGYFGDDQSEGRLLEESKAIGFPVMLKAVMGGGGKGMRVVHDAASFSEALTSCRRESKASFGDDRVLVEKYLVNPRHVELQVFSDGTQGQGGTVYLFERDCSVQRRHQKVLEEAPAPHLSAELRKQMGEAAVAAAEAVGYKGAGTVEFMLDRNGSSFYFCEMNTRLQVEHPVTEMITGQDLVEWQLRVASGYPLPLRQEELQINGHAIEARVYAENPRKGFLPATGELKFLRTPHLDDRVRVDTGVQEGDAVSIHYDPMIAKLIVWGETRDSAINKMSQALHDYQIVGVPTNLEFLQRAVSHQAFREGDVHTGFIEQHMSKLLPPDEHPPVEASALAAVAVVLSRRQKAFNSAVDATATASPWVREGSFRATHDREHAFPIKGTRCPPATDDCTPEKPDTVTVAESRRKPGVFEVGLSGKQLTVEHVSMGSDGVLRADVGGRRIRTRAVVDGSHVYLFGSGNFDAPVLHYEVTRPELGGVGAVDESSLVAPMPGKVVAVLVKPGQKVAKGTPLVVMEAMKMEHVIKAPHDGVVDSLHFGEGDLVDDGAALLELSN